MKNFQIITNKVWLRFKQFGVSKPIKVKFYTKSGERLAFKATRTSSRPKKINFYGHD